MALVPFHNAATASKRLPIQFWLRGWTQTELDDDDIEILRAADLQPARKSHGWTSDEAIKFLSDAVGNRNASDGDYERPRRLSPHQLPYGIFNDFDEIIFGGVLKGNVHLRFDRNLPNSLAGITTNPPSQSKRRMSVELSKDLVFKGSPPAIAEVLMHQMIHAFLLQCCGPKTNSDGHDLRHGLAFSTAALVVVRACGLRQFGDHPAALGVMAQRGQPRSSDGSSTTSSGEYSSRCYHEGYPQDFCKHKLDSIQASTETPTINLDKQCPKDKTDVRRPITQYYHIFKDSRFKPVLRSGSGGIPVDHIELHYGGRAIPVACSSSLRSLDSKKNTTSPSLVIPFVDDKAFSDLYKFVVTGAYAPALEGQLGPPRLAQGIGIEKPICLRDIRAYRMGLILGVHELQEYALKRLWSHATTFEDPVEALEYLYHGPPPPKEDEKKSGSDSKGAGKGKNSKAGSDDKKEKPRGPDEPLRTWARAWLKVAHNEYGYNLNLLRRHAGWSDAWKKLKTRGGPLIADVDAVDEEVPSWTEQQTLDARNEGGWTSVPTNTIQERPHWAQMQYAADRPPWAQAQYAPGRQALPSRMLAGPGSWGSRNAAPVAGHRVVERTVAPEGGFVERRRQRLGGENGVEEVLLQQVHLPQERRAPVRAWPSY